MASKGTRGERRLCARRFALLSLGLSALACEFHPDAVGWPGYDVPDGGVLDSDDPAAADADPSAPDAAPGTADAAPAGLFMVSWNGQRWQARGNADNAGYPQFSGAEVILTPNVPGRSGVVFLADTVVPPFQIEFDYQTTDTDGCMGASCSLNSASGIVFMFGKDLGPYMTQDPPTGEQRGFISGSGGGVHFEIYNVRQVTMRDSYLTPVKAETVETYAPTYRHVFIDVLTVGLNVYLDGYLAMSYLPTNAWSTTHHYLGFGAATGSVSAEQRIANVAVY